MAKAYAKKFYNSKEWRSCRASFISERITIDGGMCQSCKESPGYIVDHVIELNSINIKDPTITLNFNNFNYLCLVCHNKKTFTKHKNIRDGLTFDEEGNLIREI